MRQLNVCVVGGEGYIGTRIVSYLRTRDHLVTVIDLGWYGTVAPSTAQWDIRTQSPVATYDVIIWLAGHSSVGMCRTNKLFVQSPAYWNNVTAFNGFLSNMRLEPNKTKPLIIYASSASIYGNTSGLYVNEIAIPWSMNFDEWCDEGDREIYDMSKLKVDNIAHDYYEDTENMIVGLRFGTVNSPSYNMRTELLLNSMVKDAINHKEVYYSQPHICRSILDLDHLTRIIVGLLEANENRTLKSGVYNVATYTRNVYDLAEIVSKAIPGTKLIENVGATKSKYDFKLDCSKLEKAIDIQFHPDIHHTISRLIEHYKDGLYEDTNRNDPHD